MSITGTAWDKAEWEKCHSWRDSPFDLAAPYEWVVGLEREGKIYGHVLDLGCGAGHNGIFLAGQGYRVTGVDLSSTAIERARQKASERGVQAEFVTGNACELGGYEVNFDTVIDIGCFHSLREENQAAYAAAVHRACRRAGGADGWKGIPCTLGERRPAAESFLSGLGHYQS